MLDVAQGDSNFQRAIGEMIAKGKLLGGKVTSTELGDLCESHGLGPEEMMRVALYFAHRGVEVENTD